MKLHQLFVFAALAALFGASGTAWAQVPDLPEAEPIVPDVPRFQVDTHDFSYNGNDYEIFIKLDRHTGQSWRFHASKGVWTPIAEPKDGPSMEPSDHNRYELFVHDYRKTGGIEEEMFIRMDMETGVSWSYRGVYPAWKALSEAEEPTPSEAETAAK